MSDEIKKIRATREKVALVICTQNIQLAVHTECVNSVCNSRELKEGCAPGHE